MNKESYYMILSEEGLDNSLSTLHSKGYKRFFGKQPVDFWGLYGEKTLLVIHHEYKTYTVTNSDHLIAYEGVEQVKVIF